MKLLRGISKPFAGEQVLASLPPLGPYARAGAGEAPLRKRLNFFAQRALTHGALSEEQRGRAAAAERMAQAVAPGVVRGLELSLEGRETLLLLPGQAIAADGRDLALAYPLRVRADAIKVLSPRVEAALSVGGSRGGLQSQASLAQVLAELGGAGFLPHAMVLIAQPLSIALDRSEALDSPCPNALDQLGDSQAAWEDGFQLAWVPWPETQSLPPWSADGLTPDPRFRNRLAYAVFNAERERLSLSSSRSLRAWTERAARDAPDLLPAPPWPWERLGVPLSIVAFDADFRPLFADRASVVRQGGGRRNRSSLVSGSGDDVLWQARVAQLLEQLAELPAAQRRAEALTQQFDWLPPAGVLPLELVDLVAGRQRFFPPQFELRAEPVPLDMVDALIAESASMMPFNLSLRDQVQLLVPVPARFFEADLLKLDERVHPLFDLEIQRLTAERLSLLTRRDGLRRRYDLLTQAIAGELPAYPQDDLNALPDESGALDAQAFKRLHVSRVAAGGAEMHQFSGAHLKLDLQASDALIVFVRLLGSPAGIALRPLISGDALENPPATRPLSWGQVPAEAQGERIGELPVAGVWTRLSVPVARAGLAGQRIDGLAFALFGGDAAAELHWGYAGKLGQGQETFWLSDALPPGATPAGTWSWLTQGEAVDAALDLAWGLPIAETRRLSELDRLLADWRALRGGVLTVELGEPTGSPRKATTPPRTVDGGLDELIQRLEGRIKAAGDHVDFGFLRSRIDIFRMRQSLLGVDDAGRFLTSPAAAELVKRNENPVATEKEFADYFKRLNDKASNPPDFKEQRGAVPAGLDVAAAAAPAALALTDGGRASAGSAINRLALDRLPSRIVPIDSGVKPSGTIKLGSAVSKQSLATTTARPAQLSVEVPPAIKDVVGASLIGATYNTVTVAERFTLPASVVSSNTAAKGKNDFVQAGLAGLQASGLAVADLPVYGYRKGEGEAGKKVTAAELLAGGVSDIDAVEVGSDLHEAVYFRRGVDAIDNTIRFLRGIELRAEDYRRLQSDAKAARERMLGVSAEIQKRLAALALNLAEVRHDLSVARALRSEEQARIAALIARRKAVLAEQVPYLVFRRPRLAATLVDVPVLAAQAAEFEDPVPRCRGEAHRAPPELLAMVDSLREVPVRWLRPLAQSLLKLDRVDDLQQLLATAQQRLQTGRHIGVAVRGKSDDSLTGRLLQSAFECQDERLLKSREQAVEQLVRFAPGSSWQQAIAPLQQIASVADLLLTPAAPRAVTLAALGLLDDIAGVGACLHAGFCTVPALLRLRWAELMSQLDEAASLRQLSVLPGFGSAGLDHADWRRLQAMVDWLFAQVSAEDLAQQAINDLVRVCLLLAAHAPVKRILSARIKRAVPARVDARFELEVDPQLTRIGMQVLVQAPGDPRLLARAVIEDIAEGLASARVTHVEPGPALSLDASLRVQLQTGPALSPTSPQLAEARRR